MPLNNQKPARDAGYQNLQYFHKHILFSDTITTFTFRIPAYSIIMPAFTGVDVSTVYNAGTNNRIQVGIAGAVSKYGLNLTLATLGFQPIAVAVGHRVTVDTDVLFTIDVTGTAATTGEADLLLAFRPPN